MTTPHRTLREAAQMALDALLIGYHRGTHDAIAALREALAAPEPEPVARCILDNGDEMGSVEWLVRPRSIRLDHGSLLYAAPPAAPAPAASVPDGWVPNAEEVICPNCAHQFRAIPENVQSLLLASGHEPPFTASPAAPVPDGMVMVPMEPTEAMMDAGERAFIATARPGVTWAEHTGNIYRAMIAASPAAPVVREPRQLTKERLQRHALFAADAPPSSAVVLLSSLHRLLGITGASK